eukprot:tig00000586_g2244.t1
MFQGECTHSDIITVVCGALFLVSELLGGTERVGPNTVLGALKAAALRVIKGVYLELDTTAIPDPTAAKTVNVLLMDVPDLNVTTISNVNTCINKVVIRRGARRPREHHPLLVRVPMAVRPNYVAYDKFQELRVRFTDITGATKKNNAFIVKNFGSGLCEIDFAGPLKCA